MLSNEDPELAYYETIPFLSDAINREKQLKGWSGAKKIALIKQDYHKLQLLEQCNNLTHHKCKDLRQSDFEPDKTE